MVDVGKPRLVMVLTEDWFFCSHFLERAIAARDAGYEVTVLANDNGKSAQIRAAGVDFIAIPLKRRGLNPLVEIKTLRAIRAAYRRLRPALAHHVGLKPILYGSLAARSAGIRAVLNAPIGMGFVFTSQSLQSRLLRPLAWLALRLFLNPRGSKVVFENVDDLKSLVEDRAVRAQDAVLIRGSGIDVASFAPAVETDGPPIVSLVSRMLWDKGVGEFVEAARKLRAEGVAAHFWLVGATDPQNPAAISEGQLLKWRAEGVVDWLGQRDDIPALLARSQIACLPSYREGLPRSLLEAMAAGLPIVSTDVPGCREAVRHGENGLLVPARDSLALASALRTLIEDPVLRRRFGVAGRRRAEREFASSIVIAETLAVYADLRRPAASAR
ncbi:glycosyltransferase family 4 protein [Methylocapsa sp. S129]|uniref:glycosyltransferase family 4 protein n=1 Tax=Methylocapsa sp. S129 TaxID=1641869 RepID=UPI00131CE161|nr:glycosyltransferase family 4 protein [Methylocapsa sp. S129]